jgi:glycosyltransferase involved in cell wall biosynthesis
MNKICCIFNVAPHYRAPIYRLMDKELRCDFYFGDRTYEPIKLMDYKELKNYKGIVQFVPLFSFFYWQKKSVQLVLKDFYTDIFIIGEPYCLSNWCILILGKLMHKKVYLWTHGWYGRESLLKRHIKLKFFGLAYHIFLYGDYAKKLMINEGVPVKKMTCIYNSLDYDKHLELRNLLEPSAVYNNYFKNSNQTLLFVGRLTKQKNLEMLLKAVALLKDKSLLFNLVLVGDGEKKQELLLLSEELGISNQIWFYGACYDEGVLSTLIYNADICVSPGNVGLTAIHSLSYGTPVITHDDFTKQMPEFEAITSDETGSFFKYNQVDSLAETICNWFEKKKDRNVIKNNCYNIIDKKYNPYYQITVLKDVILNS